MQSLTGKLLIAMPGMGDPRFERSVVLLCEHSEDGAMGIIVNKPTPEVDGGELLRQLGIESDDSHAPVIHFGGPVETGRGFVIHSREYEGADQTLTVTNEIGMTATLDILQDIAAGNGPDHAILALGYAGWGPGQLETEIAANGWLTADSAAGIIFAKSPATRWEAAIESLGIDVRMLSNSAGHA